MTQIHMAEWLLTRLLGTPDRDAALGDLAEEHAWRARNGSHMRAALWYWGQISRSIPWLVWIAIRRGGSGAIRIVVAACIMQAVLELIAATCLRSFPASVPGTGVVAFVVVVASLFTTGYLTERIRAGAGTLFAVVVLALLTLQTILRPSDGFGVAHVTLTTIAALIAFAGSAMSANHRSPRVQ